MTLGKIPCMG